MAIVSRFITIVLGYFAGLFTFFLALISIFGVLAAMSSKPGLWMLGPMSPAILISAPAVLIFAILAAVLLSLIPFLLILLPSEFFGWKSPVGYCLIASLSAAGAYASVSPRFIWDINEAGIVEIIAFAMAGVIGGGIYWLVAGGNAGNWRGTRDASV